MLLIFTFGLGTVRLSFAEQGLEMQLTSFWAYAWVGCMVVKGFGVLCADISALSSLFFVPLADPRVYSTVPQKFASFAENRPVQQPSLR